MIIYADVTFINNFLMTLAIIWAVANIMERDYRWFNLLLAALVANIYFFLVLIIQNIDINNFITVFLQILLNITAAIVIIRIAFPKIKKRNLIKAVSYLYLITFITIGTTLSVFYVYGGSPFDAGMQKIIIGMIILFLIGNFGWRYFQKYKTPEEFYLPVKIYYLDIVVNIIGLLDTGNSLTDPFTKAPVIVVNLEDIISLFSEKIQEELWSCGEDYIKAIEVFNSHGLGQRIRILPFSDLGKENGMILGFRPDFIELEYQGRILKVKKCILALSRRRLDVDNEYQALIHPQLINSNEI